MRGLRGRSPPRHHCALAPRATTHWARLVRRVVLRAAPAPGLASRALIYSDPDLARQRGVGELIRASGLQTVLLHNFRP
jgi:hypothetical protein